MPLEIAGGEGVFTLNAATQICVDNGDSEMRSLAELLAQGIYDRTKIRLSVADPADKTGGNFIALERVNALMGKEGYTLCVTDKAIAIKAESGAGIFYALTTFYQLLPAGLSQAASVFLPAVAIKDKPRFGWRGVMLDVARYFFSVDYLKKYIDHLALHKLNVFHWHLVDDHGWRIEIKKHPRLTQAGAWRKSTNFQRGNYINRHPHGGFYSQDDVREIIAYAQSRYVRVIPEIELPGHALSALIAYPELSCTGGPFEFPEQWAIQKDIYCAGNEKVFALLEDVLSEVVELFPSEIVHIGGDEAPKDRWQACPHCQERIRKEGLKDEHALQSYFITRIEQFLNAKGKHIIGWDEILEGGLAPNAAVMSWRGVEGGIEAARQRHPVVMTPLTHMYFDYFQGEAHLEPFNAIGSHLPLRKVYAYEPLPKELTPEEQAFILGVQGNVWTEYVHSEDKCDYMTFPRAAALAEVAWSAPERKDWDSFVCRMESLYKRYEALGIAYAKSAYQVYFEVQDDLKSKQAVVELKTDSYAPQIHYTLDGTMPTLLSPSYKKPITVPEYATIRAANFRDGKRMGSVNSHTVWFGAE